MKRIIFTIAIALMGYASFGQQASQLIPTQGLNPKTFTPPNFLYVNQADNRIWPVLADSVRLKYINIKWINDSVIVIGTRKFVRKDSVYSNPSFISNIDYNTKIANKPNLSAFLTASTAASTYQPLGSYYPLTGNPNNFLTSESDPLFSAQITNYRTKLQNDLIYQPLGSYLTSFTEVDPTVSAYAKSLSSFASIKASTDVLYKSLSYTPSNSEVVAAIGFTPYSSTNPSGYISSVPAQSFASLTGKPTGLAGYGITDAYPLSGNPSGFLTGITSAQVNSALGYAPYNGATNPNGYISVVPSQSFASISEKPTTLSGFGITDGVTSSTLSSSLSNYVLTSTYTAGLAAKQNSLTLTTTGSGAATLIGSTLNIPTPVVSAYTAGTGISVAGNVITNTSPNQTVVITGSNGVTASGTYPNFNIQQTTPTYNNAPGRTLGTSFRPSTTRPTRVSYTVSITTAISLLNLNSAGSVALQISSDNINFTTINSAGISRTLAVSISVGLNETTMFNIQGEVPAGFYCRLQGTVSGGATSTFTSGQEVTY